MILAKKTAEIMCPEVNIKSKPLQFVDEPYQETMSHEQEAELKTGLKTHKFEVPMVRGPVVYYY
jgi:hypothetical protein